MLQILRDIIQFILDADPNHLPLILLVGVFQDLLDPPKLESKFLDVSDDAHQALPRNRVRDCLLSLFAVPGLRRQLADAKDHRRHARRRRYLLRKPEKIFLPVTGEIESTTHLTRKRSSIP